MNLKKIYAKPDLCLKSVRNALRDTSESFYIKGWEQIEKENVETATDTTLPEVLRIQAEGFEKERQREIIKYFKKSRKIFYVIKNQSKVIGYCIYYLKPAFSSRGFEKKAVIYSIAVDSKFRNRGFGRKLLEESIREMKQNKALSIALYVNVNNIPAIKLYEKVGFLIVQKVENMCGQKERCYKMELKLF
jgi:ribosomal-protein-alanine N-acetyltransferase